jgi:small subunit ribosomal protein S4
LGDPRKKRKKYETPRHPWRKDQIEVELKLIGEYGLRNKRELWRYKTMLSQVRSIARSLLARSESERVKAEKEYLQKLSRVGVLPEETSIDDVLDLDIRGLLERRLQTIVFRAGLSKSIHQARQLISHGHIMIGNRVIAIPSYIVQKTEESAIKYSPHSALSRTDHPARKAPVARAAREPRAERPAEEIQEEA